MVKKEEKVEDKTVGEIKIGACNYNVVVKGDVEGEHEVELVGTSCERRSDAKESTKIVDAIFSAKKLIYTPPQKFNKEEVLEVD